MELAPVLLLLSARTAARAAAGRLLLAREAEAAGSLC